MENNKLYDDCIELSAELERARIIKIIDDVTDLPVGGGESLMPTPFQVGYQLACEEIMYRVQTDFEYNRNLVD